MAFLLFLDVISTVKVLFIIEKRLVPLYFISGVFLSVCEIGHLQFLDIIRESRDNARIDIVFKTESFGKNIRIIVFANQNRAVVIVAQVNYHLHFLLNHLMLI